MGADGEVDMIKPGLKSTEFYLYGAAALVTVLDVVGVDAKVIVAQVYSEEFADVLKLVREAHSGGGWQSVVAMWGGVALYSWLRTKIKLGA
jgi:hypothetical protein